MSGLSPQPYLHIKEAFMKKILSLYLSLCLSVTAPLWAQQPKPQSPAGSAGESLEVGSESLGAVVLGQKVQLMMRDGTYVAGKVIRSDRDEIRLRVDKSEPSGRVRGPEATLRTSEISVIYFKKNGTVALPVVLGVVGGFGALYGAAFAAQNVPSLGGYLGICLASAAGGATGGALLGREVGRKTLTINVVPSRHVTDIVAIQK
jgi:hypothetical protein